MSIIFKCVRTECFLFVIELNYIPNLIFNTEIKVYMNHFLFQSGRILSSDAFFITILLFYKLFKINSWDVCKMLFARLFFIVQFIFVSNGLLWLSAIQVFPSSLKLIVLKEM